MIDKRINPNFCKEHRKVFCFQRDDTLYCLAHECEWTAPKRRKEDKEAPTLGEVKTKWN